MAKKESVQEEVEFLKAEILKSKKYSNTKDLVIAVLPDNFVGTVAEADSEIEKYLKGKVK